MQSCVCVCMGGMLKLGRIEEYGFRRLSVTLGGWVCKWQCGIGIRDQQTVFVCSVCGCRRGQRF